MAGSAFVLSLAGRAVFVHAGILALDPRHSPGWAAFRIPPAAGASYLYSALVIEIAERMAAEEMSLDPLPPSESVPADAADAGAHPHGPEGASEPPPASIASSPVISPPPVSTPDNTAPTLDGPPAAPSPPPRKSLDRSIPLGRDRDAPACDMGSAPVAPADEAFIEVETPPRLITIRGTRLPGGVMVTQQILVLLLVVRIHPG
jgi:hypothetical protein